MSRFCTCHDSLAVVARAESRHDLIIIIKLEQFSKELITEHAIIKLLWNARLRDVDNYDNLSFEVTHIHEYASQLPSRCVVPQSDSCAGTVK